MPSVFNLKAGWYNIADVYLSVSHRGDESMKPWPTAQEPVDSFEVDDVRIGYNPALQVSGASTPESLVFQFHSRKGWMRMSLKGDVCRLFDRRYHEHTEGGLK